MAKITLKSQGKYTAKEGKGTYVIMLGLLGGTSGKEPTCLPMPETWRNKRLGFSPWVRKIPWRKAQPPTPLFLPGGSCGPSSLENTVHGVAKSQTLLTRLSTYPRHACSSRCAKSISER